MPPVGPLVPCVSGASPGDQNWSCGQKRGQVAVLLAENPTHNLFCSSDVQSQHISVFVPGVCVELSSLNMPAGVGWVVFCMARKGIDLSRWSVGLGVGWVSHLEEILSCLPSPRCIIDSLMTL